MYTNLYLVEKLDRQRHQDFTAQAARDYTAVQLPDLKHTRSQTMKRMKLITAAVIIAATLLGAAAHPLTVHQTTVPAEASLCCWQPRT